MTESIYKEYENKYYNPDDSGKKPGDNDNWKSIQKGFHDIGTTQLETTAGLTLGKGTADEVSVTAAELGEMKDDTKLKNFIFNYRYVKKTYHLISDIAPGEMRQYTFGEVGIGYTLKPNTRYCVIVYPVNCYYTSGQALPISWHMRDLSGYDGIIPSFVTDDTGRTPTDFNTYTPLFDVGNTSTIPTGTTLYVNFIVMLYEV